MRKSLRLDRLPQPLSLSNKLNLGFPQDPSPYLIGQQIKQNRLKSSRKNTGLSQMKQQLLQIKDDMIKLFTTKSDEEISSNDPPDLLCQALKQELVQMKQSEQKLRREIQSNKTEYSKALNEVKQQKDNRMQQIRRDMQAVKNNYERVIEDKDDEISRLREDVTKIENYSKNMLGIQRSKYDALSVEFSSLENTIKQLQSGNIKQQQDDFIEGIETKRINIQLSTQLEQIRMELQNYKTNNMRLQKQLKTHHTRQTEYLNTINKVQNQHICLLERLHAAEQQGKNSLQLNSQEINSQRMEIINHELTINDLQEQNYVLTEHNKFIRNILGQTDNYVKALENQLEKYGSVIKGNKNKKQN